jgi:hypothetical protein
MGATSRQKRRAMERIVLAFELPIIANDSVNAAL